MEKNSYIYWLVNVTKYPLSCCSVPKFYLTLCNPWMQHTRLPSPSLPPRVCSNSCSSSQWCHLTTSSSSPPSSPWKSVKETGNTDFQRRELGTQKTGAGGDFSLWTYFYFLNFKKWVLYLFKVNKKMFNMPLCTPSLFPILSSELQLRIFNPEEYSHFMSISRLFFFENHLQRYIKSL